jgi:chromosome segregation ATPase
MMNQFMPIATRDIYLLQINQEIQNKKKLLIKKKKELEKKEDSNELLSTVKQDYTKYYDYIIKQKQDQYNAMQLLNEYLDDLMKTDKIVSKNLKTAKYDQKEILNEINKIKGELDELIDNGNNTPPNL